MTDIRWTESQEKRLKELGVEPNTLLTAFSNSFERDQLFQSTEWRQIQQNKKRMEALLQNGGRVALEHIKEKLTAELCRQGFTRVATPIILSKKALARMTIDESHPLCDQVYWLDKNTCLRPMLAPHLYSLMADFGKLEHRPIRFFEIGPCFRKESDGARHNAEFTMLNLVEMGTPLDKRLATLEALATCIVKASGITDYRFEHEESTVYGTTIDIVSGSDNLEVASGAMGPHPLDIAWKVNEPWVGLGFGIERLLMAAADEQSISRWGISLNYCSGIRLSF